MRTRILIGLAFLAVLVAALALLPGSLGVLIVFVGISVYGFFMHTRLMFRPVRKPAHLTMHPAGFRRRASSGDCVMRSVIANSPRDRGMLPQCLLLLTGVALSCSSLTQGATTWTMWQTTLHSTRQHANPYTDVELRVKYAGPHDEEYDSLGFWDGGDRVPSEVIVTER